MVQEPVKTTVVTGGEEVGTVGAVEETGGEEVGAVGSGEEIGGVRVTSEGFMMGSLCEGKVT